MEDGGAVVLLDAGDVGLGVDHPAREHEFVGHQLPAVPQGDVESPVRTPVRRLDDVRDDRGARVGEDLLAAARQQLARRLRVPAQVPVRVLDPVRPVLAGVHHEHPPAESGEPRRSGESRRPAADDDCVDLALDRQSVHGTGSK